jgi:hypothetical protein
MNPPPLETLLERASKTLRCRPLPPPSLAPSGPSPRPPGAPGPTRHRAESGSDQNRVDSVRLELVPNQERGCVRHRATIGRIRLGETWRKLESPRPEPLDWFILHFLTKATIFFRSFLQDFKSTTTSTFLVGQGQALPSRGQEGLSIPGQQQAPVRGTGHLSCIMIFPSEIFRTVLRAGLPTRPA